MTIQTLIYQPPSLPTLLTISSFLYLANVAHSFFDCLIHAGLLGPLLIGIAFGPQAADLLPTAAQSTFVSLGYIGLVLLVFDAGLSTDVALLFANIYLSVVVALTGVLLPIALSLLLLHFGYGYSGLQAFAAGAALCSTSLGTTLALLDVEARATRVGAVLMSAALLDDIAGLVIAAIISRLSSNPSHGAVRSISWQAIVRPVLVSLAFAFGTPLLAYALRLAVRAVPTSRRRRLSAEPTQLLILVATLSAFVAGSAYAGTSELFGAYLAGALLTHVFRPPPPPPPPTLQPAPPAQPATPTPHATFAAYLRPPLLAVLSPLFFASIGMALPVRALVSVGGSHAVVWRGAAYAGAMVLAKAAVGLWVLVWPEGRQGRPGCAWRVGRAAGARRGPPRADPAVPKSDLLPPPLGASKPRAAVLLGLAMVARGEIALIVAQLARPLLAGSSDAGGGVGVAEPFAVVVWAILVTTVAGAVGVGWALRRAENGDRLDMCPGTACSRE